MQLEKLNPPKSKTAESSIEPKNCKILGSIGNGFLSSLSHGEDEEDTNVVGNSSDSESVSLPAKKGS